MLPLSGSRIRHIPDQLQLEVVKKASRFLSIDDIQEHLMHFQQPSYAYKSEEELAQRILVEMAVRQGKIDLLEDGSWLHDAKITAVLSLAQHVGIEAANDYRRRHHVAPTSKEKEWFDAQIASWEAVHNPAKLDNLLQHFNGNGGHPHPFCQSMMVLPTTLRRMMKADKLSRSEIITLAESLIEPLLAFNCADLDDSRADGLSTKQDKCRSNKNLLISELVSLVYSIDQAVGRRLLVSLPSEPVKVYAIRNMLIHGKFEHELMNEFIQLCEECIDDELARAKVYYDVARRLPIAFSDAIDILIALGQKTLSKDNQDTKVLYAQALLNRVATVEQISEAQKAFDVMKTFIPLDYKLNILGFLLPQASQVSTMQDKLMLLRKLLELIRKSSLTDVEAFIAYSLPIIHSIGGDKAFWLLYERIKWAYSA